jgi:hypothetical protein
MEGTYPEIEKRLQLHEKIEIYYVVDGYCAEFKTGDGDIPLIRVHGVTVKFALDVLEEAVSCLPEELSRLRARKPISPLGYWNK